MFLSCSFDNDSSKICFVALIVQCRLAWNSLFAYEPEIRLSRLSKCWDCRQVPPCAAAVVFYSSLTWYLATIYYIRQPASGTFKHLSLIRNFYYTYLHVCACTRSVIYVEASEQLVAWWCFTWAVSQLPFNLEWEMLLASHLSVHREGVIIFSFSSMVALLSSLLHSESKGEICFSVDGLPNNFRIHPLQIDQCGDPPNNTDGSESKSASSVHETKKASTAVIRGACLTLTDHDRIRQFIQEFTFRGLLPHIEKTIRQLNDQVRRKFFLGY